MLHRTTADLWHHVERLDTKEKSESVYLYCPTNGEMSLLQQQKDSSTFKNNNNREK